MQVLFLNINLIQQRFSFQVLKVVQSLNQIIAIFYLSTKIKIESEHSI